MQLPLAIEFPETATFDNYQVGSNVLLLDLMRKSVTGSGELQLYIWASSGLGKTHLLQSACREASAFGRKSCYLPIDVMRQHGSQILDGLETLDLVAIDDLDQLIGESDWQESLFTLINRCRTVSVPLLFAARTNIGELNLELADLASRLSWGPVFEIKALNDAEKKEVLQARARHRSLELNDDAVNYLLGRYPRDMRQLCDLLEILDKASLSAQRRLTIPFIKTVLELS